MIDLLIEVIENFLNSIAIFVSFNLNHGKRVQDLSSPTMLLTAQSQLSEVSLRTKLAAFPACPDPSIWSHKQEPGGIFFLLCRKVRLVN